MQFNNTTLKNGIIQDCEDRTTLGRTAISGNADLLAEFTNKINQAYNRVISWIMEVQGQWKYDDSNYSDSFAEATTTLEANQADYTLPGATAGANFSTFLRLIGVKVLDVNGKWKDLRVLLPEDERRLFNSTDVGLPTHYKLVGNSVVLFLPPSSDKVTLTSGLKVVYQRIPDQFLVTDTTQEPGISMTYQPLIPMLASYNYLKENRAFDLATDLKKDIYGDTQTGDIGLKKELQNFYATRNEEVRPRLQARSRRISYE